MSNVIHAHFPHSIRFETHSKRYLLVYAITDCANLRLLLKNVIELNAKIVTAIEHEY